MKGEGKMRKEIKGIVMILLLIAAIAVIPLTARAEMQAMTDSELEIATAQMTIGDGLVLILNTFVVPETVKFIGVKNATALANSLSKLLAPLQPFLSQLSPFITPILNTEIPCTK